MFGSTSPQIGSASPDTSYQPPKRGRWRRRLSLSAVLTFGASMAVVGVTSTGAMASPTNVALNKTATASSYYHSLTPPSDAVDGSTAGVSQGSDGSKWASAIGSGDKWLDVDLGATYDITGFVVKHAGAGGETASLNTRAFTISTKLMSGHSWTQRASETANTANVTTKTISSVYARYVRLNITQAEQSANGAARIYEFEVTGDVLPMPTMFYDNPLRDGWWDEVDSSMTSTPYNSNCGGEKVFDGSVSSVDDSKWCTTAPGTKEITIKTTGAGGYGISIVGIYVGHAGAGGESSALNTRAYKVYTSRDGSNWNLVGNVTDNTSNWTSHDLWTSPNNWSVHYVRLEITQGEQASNNAARIYEVMVDGGLCECYPA